MWMLLEAHLVGSRPRIWRRFVVPASLRLPKLHKVLQLLFQWQDYHLHHFDKAGAIYEDPTINESWDIETFDSRRVSLEDLLSQVGSTLIYRYDFGDGWTVRIKLEARTEQGSCQVLAGERAGPPEDCGGLPGLQHLNRVLAKPRHPEHGEMRQWVGPSYQADQLNLPALNKKLARLFPAPKVRPSPLVKDPATALNFTPVGPRLENYKLKNLSLRALMLAALVERGAPMTLEELAERIEAAGQPLSQGALSLKKAWRQEGPFHQRRDQRLELNLDHPEIWRYDADLLQQRGTLPPLEEGPLRLEELEQLSQSPLPFTKAEWTLALAEAMAGPTLSELCQQLERWGKKFKGDRVVMDGSRVLPAERQAEVRAKFRQRLAERQHWAQRAQQRRQGASGLGPWHLACWQGDLAVVREIQSGAEFSLQGHELADFLKSVKVLFAADVFGLYEQAGILASPQVRRFDLMPLPFLRGQRQYDPRLRLEDFIQASLHTCYDAQAPLSQRLNYHAALLAYGQLHGFLVPPEARGYFPQVFWDVGLEGHLRDRFLLALKEDRDIWVSHRPPDPLRPELYRAPLRVERPGELQVYGRFGGVETTLFYKDIYLAHSPPCATSSASLAYRFRQPDFLTPWADEYGFR